MRTVYGVRSEKLVEFGLKPQRKRVRLKSKKKPVEPSAPAVTESGGAAT